MLLAPDDSRRGSRTVCWYDVHNKGVPSDMRPASRPVTPTYVCVYVCIV